MNNFSIVLLIGIFAWQSYLLFNATRLAANATKLAENATKRCEDATKLAEDATKLAVNTTKRCEGALRDSCEIHLHALSVIEDLLSKKEYSSVQNKREI